MEQLFGPVLERPELTLSGSPGYAHRTAARGLWESKADRFAGAILLAEMLGWCDERIRTAAWGESYFDPAELQGKSDRYNALRIVMEQEWGLDMAALLEQAWQSETLADCPTFGEWLVTLPQTVPVYSAASSMRPGLPTDQTPAAKANDVAVRTLVAAAQRLEQLGNLHGAAEIYRQALGLAGAGTPLTQQVQSLQDGLEAKSYIGNPALDSPSALGPGASSTLSSKDAIDEHTRGSPVPSTINILVSKSDTGSSETDDTAIVALERNNSVATVPATTGVPKRWKAKAALAILFAAVFIPVVTPLANPRSDVCCGVSWPDSQPAGQCSKCRDTSGGQRLLFPPGHQPHQIQRYRYQYVL